MAQGCQALGLMEKEALGGLLYSPVPKESLFTGLPEPSSVPDKVREVEANLKSSVLSSSAGRKRLVNDAKAGGDKKVRFKTTVDASPEQVLGAMQKIAAHIGNPTKFSKASKLAAQLAEAGSVTRETVDSFFCILKEAMASPSRANEPSLRNDYLALFTAVQEHVDCLSAAQEKQVEVWLLWVQMANDLNTDDSFVFSKATGVIRQAIDALPDATEEENSFDYCVPSTADLPVSNVMEVSVEDNREADPFGLNLFLPKISKKEERLKRKKEEEAAAKRAAADAGKLLRERREALIGCLKMAANRYKMPWAQTGIDITAKHAHDNLVKFTASQRDAIETLWASVRDQQLRRKQGKTICDITPFERLQAKYANEKISIRKAVGSGGDRSAEQWLG